MNIIKFDSNCTGCKLCYKACWLDVIRWDAEKKRPIAAYPEDCVDCNFCEVCCPTKAIHVNIDFKKPMPRSY
ncbi:MAG: 4Fe-4S dicluster domain-containing protein [Clostridiales Family XIII bacterium]|jgi:NAD-dependent dihydropyrimidine dehydrogenase PreA subunit|nr:4Fe-4S dicluster domain-containing protein [Clostridiales Family XIII bacterium]